MGKKSKKGKEFGTVDTTEADKAVPKSIIIYRGEVGPHVRSLMHEWRRMFLPWSSKKLHATNNRLKDFIHISSTFSASHLQLFTCPSAGTSLRIMRFTNGPTLTFRVESFTLRDDIVNQQKKPAPIAGPMYEVAPIVVLNNFNSPSRPAEVALLESTFQSLFPSINIQLVKPEDIQRVVMFHHDPNNDLVEVRHVYIASKAVGLSRTVKKLTERRIPTKLGTLDNLDEVFDKEGAWSDTDGEGEEVELPRPFRNHKEQCRVKLIEIGPRLTLRLLKVEAGFGEGQVLYHDHITKSAAEVAEDTARVRARVNEKAKRRKEQEENVRRKKDARQEKVDRRKAKRQRREDDDGDGDLEVVQGGYDAEDE